MADRFDVYVLNSRSGNRRALILRLPSNWSMNQKHVKAFVANGDRLCVGRGVPGVIAWSMMSKLEALGGVGELQPVVDATPVVAPVVASTPIAAPTPVAAPTAVAAPAPVADPAVVAAPVVAPPVVPPPVVALPRADRRMQIAIGITLFALIGYLISRYF